jgi:hypothetical protein
MANQPVVDLIVAPCRVVAVKVSSKDDIRPSAGVLRCLSDGGQNLV